jgi:nucleotide-binding universal stress UspA family protein
LICVKVRAAKYPYVGGHLDRQCRRSRGVKPMMRTVLVPLAKDFADEPAFEAAFFIAKRMNSHIHAIFVRPDPVLAISYIPDVVAATGVSRDVIEREGLQAAEAEKARFDAWRKRHDMPDAAVDNRLDSRFATWAEQVGEIEQVVTHFGRVSDLIVMSRFTNRNITASRCFDAAVFGSGRPVLVVPEKLPWDMLDHVMIAWNGSLEASHAMFGAIPLLRAAQRVSIFSVPESESEESGAAELAEALSWYGIPTNNVGRPETPGSTGAALLAMARRTEATLVVMGAYTHSRLRQSFLGGVTQQILAEATLPVLMSH